MKTISFIIPAYNSAAFLEKCLDSMLQKPLLDKLEVLVVNDGSTDATPQLAQSYCERFPGTVRLLSQPNKGHGGALNTGCAAAAGKYLKVIDADDWVNTEGLPDFLAALERCESDVVLTHYRTHNITTGEVLHWRCFPPQFGKSYTFGDIMQSWRSYDRCLTFHGITYRTDFYKAHAKALPEHVFYEDHAFATFPCCYAAQVQPLDLFVYEYRIGDVSQSVSAQNQLKRLGHTEAVLRHMLAEYLTVPACPGKDYAAQKLEGLLLSYLSTALLVEPDKRKGRTQARQLLQLFHTEAPAVGALAKPKATVFLAMNRLHLGRGVWDAVLHSRLYNTLRGNHDFA